MYNATNLKLIDGGYKIKQGDKSSNYSFELQDENEKAINLDDKNATVLLVKDGEVKYKKVVKVSGSIVSFTIDKFLEVGKYPLEIHCDGYVFPSNDSIKINVVKSFVSEEVVEDEKEKEVEKSFDNSYLEKYFEKYPSLNRDLVFDYTIFDGLSDEEIFSKGKELVKPYSFLKYNYSEYYEVGEFDMILNPLFYFLSDFFPDDTYYTDRVNRFYTKHDKNIFLQYLDILLRVPIKLKDFSISSSNFKNSNCVLAVNMIFGNNCTWEIVSGSEHIEILGKAINTTDLLMSMFIDPDTEVAVNDIHYKFLECISGEKTGHAILVRGLIQGTAVVRVTHVDSGKTAEITLNVE